MVMDALRGYLQLANGLTDVTRQRALAAAKALAASGTEVLTDASAVPATVSRQVQALADDLLATSRSNRDLLVGLVRSEVERTVGVLGLASGDDMESVAVHVRRIERRVDDIDARLRAAVGLTGSAAAEPAAKKAPAKKAPAKKAPAKKAPAKKAPARKAPAKAANAEKSPGPVRTPTAAVEGAAEGPGAGS
jgi:hypothetical protein